MTTLFGIAIAATPLLVIAGLLHLADRAERRRAARYARQIELTDAIHRDLGAVAAPVVKRQRGGGWLVHMMVPFDRPATVAAILGITDRTLGAAGRLQIVLTSWPRSTTTVAGRSRSARQRPVESGARALAAVR